MMAAGVGDPLKCKDLGIMALISSCNAAVGESKLRQAQVQGCSGRHGVAGVAIAGACPRACTHTHTHRACTHKHTHRHAQRHIHTCVCVCARTQINHPRRLTDSMHMKMSTFVAHNTHILMHTQAATHVGLSPHLSPPNHIGPNSSGSVALVSSHTL